MKKQIPFTLIIIIFVSSVYSNPKFEKWEIPGFFRGYNILYESPKSLQDIIDFKNYGGNLLQIQPDGFLAPEAPYDTLWENINGADMLVDFCRQAGVYYVIGMRSGPGAYDTYDESQGNTPESRIWNTGNTAEQQKYAEMLRMVVERYSEDTLFAGINLVIEPRPKVKVIPANTSQLYKFFLENAYNIHMDEVYNFWVSEIRKVDSELPVLAESFGYSTPELFPPYEVNDAYVIYSMHNYQPVEYSKADTAFSVMYPGTYWNITHLSQQLFNANFIRETIFGKVREFQEQTGSPVILGEFGMYLPQAGCADYVNDVLNVCRDYGWHFALWDWRRSGGTEWNFEKFHDENDSTWKTVLSKFHAPPVPGLISPINGENANPNPEFKWENLTDYTAYDLMITGMSKSTILIENIQNPVYTYSNSRLESGITYSWKVRAKNPGGANENISQWSEPQTFYVPAPDNINNSSKKFTLNQNSPNPFNPTTDISFNLTKASNVKLIVYDVLGREIASLVNENLRQGSHNKIFNASNLPSGVYFYRLDAVALDGSAVFTEIKRMILIK